MTSTTTALLAPSPVQYGSGPFVFATITPSTVGAPMMGSVSFYDNGTLFATQLVNWEQFAGVGVSSARFPGVPIGSHTITAVFSGDANYSGSTAPGITVSVVKAGVDLDLSSSPNPSSLCQPVALSLYVESFNDFGALPTGTAMFYNDTTPLGAAVTVVNALATMTTAALPEGDSTINAAYSGDSNFDYNDTFANPMWAIDQTVNGAAGVSLSAAAIAPDPMQSCPKCVGMSLVDLLAGAARRLAAFFSANRSNACSGSCGPKKDSSKTGTCPICLAFNSNTVNVKPIVLATLTTDFCSTVPSSIVGTLTWNGSPLASVSFSTAGHSSGDVYALPFQVTPAVATSGFYPWSVEVVTTVGTYVYDSMASGVFLVVANGNSAFGAGWSLGGTTSLIPGSVAMVDNGSGYSRIFTGTPGSLPFTCAGPNSDRICCQISAV